MEHRCDKKCHPKARSWGDEYGQCDESVCHSPRTFATSRLCYCKGWYGVVLDCSSLHNGSMPHVNMIIDQIPLAAACAWLATAAMYPLGFLFGSCSSCCASCYKFSYARESIRSNPGSCSPGDASGVVTLDLPDTIEIPDGGIEVTFSVLADDKVRVNGDWFGNQNACRTDRLTRTIKLPARQIKFEFFDTSCCGTGTTSQPACICFTCIRVPSFSRVMLNQEGGVLDIDGWKLTYPPIPPTQFSPPGAPLQTYLGLSFAESAKCEDLNPLP